MKGAIFGWALIILGLVLLRTGFYFLVKKAVKAAIRECREERNRSDD